MTAPFFGALPQQTPLAYGGGGPSASAGSNTVAGRYDNLPQSRGYEQTAALPNSQFDYAGQQRPNATMLERQFSHGIEPSVTPSSLGVMPEMHRGTGVMYQDPLTGDELKPKKREREFLFQPQGDELASRYTPVHLEHHQRVLETSKNTSGHGAMDGHTFTPDTPDESGQNALRNFGNGELKDWRTGGFHPRTRITFVPETKRGRLEHGLRLGNPSHAVGKVGSIYQTGTAPLGAVRLCENAAIREHSNGRLGMAGGGANKGVEARSVISLPHQSRDNGLTTAANGGDGGSGEDTYSRKENRGMLGATTEYNPNEFACISLATLPSTEREHTGTMGRQGASMSGPRADLSHQVRGHHAANTELHGFTNRGNDGVGGYATANIPAQLQDHDTHRADLTGRVHAAPAPFKDGMAAYAFEREQRQPSGVREVSGRAAGASSNYNASAEYTTGHRVNEYESERQSKRSEVAFAQAHNFAAPLPTRGATGVQRPETDYRNQEHRRVAPHIEQHLDHSLLSPLRANHPYAQPLPMAY